MDVGDFWALVNKTENCWLWMGGRISTGYGRLSFDRKRFLAHRFAYELVCGPIPNGMHLDHTCHQKLCVNPSHLRPVTPKQNGENLRGAHVDSSTGVLGVHQGRPGKYRARVKHRRRTYNAGTYNTIEEAAVAAKALRLQLFSHNDADRSA